MVRITEAARQRPADMQEVLKINAARPGSADGYWFDLPMWNNLPETRQAFETYRSLRRRCDELGITFDVQVFTLGHGTIWAEKTTAPHGLHPFPADAWQVDPDGRKLNMLCPRAPAVHAYVADYCAMMGETLKPNTVWLDDDLRLGFGHEDGCFCDNCLKAFNGEYGHAFTRAELAECLFKGAEREPVRREWLRFVSGSLAAYGRAARKGVDRTHPSCRLGYQSVSSASLRATGQDAKALMTALSGEGRVPTAIRIGSGCYGENLSEIVAKMLDIAREVERCRASGVPFAQICNEQENYQREILHKSAEATMVESALALAVGCDSLAEYRWGNRGEPMLDYAEFAAKLAAWRPYLKRIAAFSRGTTLGGVARFVGSDYDLTRRFSVVDENDAHISALGVPLTVRESGTRCFYVDELTVEEWGADDARKLLADGGSAVVRTNAWDALLAKGGEPIRKAAADGRIVKLDFSVLKPRNWALLPNTAERKTLLDALDRVTGGKFPVRIERSHRFYVYPRVRRADGKVAAVTFYNGSTGASPATEVRVRRPAGAYPVMALPESSDLPLYVTQMAADEIRFVIPSLRGRQVGTVIFGEACPDTAADVVRVEGERAVLPRYRDGGWWDAGYRLAALKMWEVAACGALITNAVKVVAADGRELVAGRDFKVQPDWSAVGLCGAAVSNANPVTISYAYRAERLDGWFENAEGVIDVRRGTPAASNPRPAQIPTGAKRLANCWVRGAGRYDHGRFFRCEGDFVPPKPLVPAERAFPKTLAKLRAGQRVRILAWGDSVTEASYLPDDERWQSQLAGRLGARYPQARIEMVSQGWGGRRITDFLNAPAGHAHNYTNKVLNSGADLVISEFVNDSWFTAADVSNHYGRVLADFRARGIEWVCLTPHYMMPQWTGLKGCADCDADPRAYVHALRDFAAATGVGLADASVRWGHLWREGVPYVVRFVNGVNHPDREGMSYFADAVCDLLPDWDPVAARWIGDGTNAAPAFATVFACPGDVAEAELRISGLGFYEAYLNGIRIGDRELEPTPTDYSKRVYYSTYDVKALLRPQNELTVLLGNGWYNSARTGVWRFDLAPWRDTPRMIAELTLKDAGGRMTRIGSDDTWRVVDSPVRFNDFREGEIVDARIRTSEKGERRRLATVVAAPRGRLVASGHEPARVVERLQPVAIEPLDGAWVLDYGKNLSGRIRLRVRGARPGDVVSCRYDERKPPAPRHIDVYIQAVPSTNSWKLADAGYQTDRYICCGRDGEGFAPRFTYHGFRYVTVRGLRTKPEPADATAEFIRTDYPVSGRLVTSDETFNRLVAAAELAYDCNFTDGFPTDCPHREKNGWLADATLTTAFGLYRAGTENALKDWVRVLVDQQRPNGSVPCIVPDFGWEYDGHSCCNSGPAWGTALTTIPTTLYRLRGDAAFLVETYPAMRRYCDCLFADMKDGLCDSGLPDWMAAKVTDPAKCWSARTPIKLSSTAYCYRSLCETAAAAELAGRAAEAGELRRRAATVRQAFNRAFYRGDGVYHEGWAFGEALALAFGLADEKEIPAIRRQLVRAVHAEDDHIDFGMLGTSVVFRELSKAGETALAYKMIMNTAPSFADWIRRGETTLCEDFPGKLSLNHPSFGDFAAWAYEHLAGVQCTSPGFATFRFAPQPIAALDHVEAKVRTPHGDISASWRRTPKGIACALVVPEGTQAEVRLPDAPVRTVGPGEHGFGAR